MKKNFLKWQLFITIIVFTTLIGWFYYKDNKNLKGYSDAIKFNLKSGFYNQTIDVKLKKSFSLPFGTKLYFSLDGNDPSISSNLYNSKITLKAIDNSTKVYPLKVVAYYNGQYSDIYEETYVIDKNINSNNINIISLTSNYDNLYDDDIGILVKGNFNNYFQRSDEWLRNSHITIFNENGEIYLNQEVLLGISGGSFSAFDPKSFKIKAVNDEKIDINFYNDDYNASYSLVNKYNSIRLRAGSQDMLTGNIRSGIISQLAIDSNFDGASTSQRAILFLNGEFYGIYDIQQNYSSSFLAKKYSLPDSNMIVKYKGDETNVFANDKIDTYFCQDLNVEKNREELEKYVDMDSYLIYYAIGILSNNIDWPHNNFEIWKYVGPYDTNNKYTDGRYRLLLYDVDTIFSGDIHTGKVEEKNQDVFRLIMDNNPHYKDTTFIQVMKSNVYRDKFVRIVQDLLNTSFAEDNMVKVADEEANKIEESISKYYKESGINNFLFHVEYIKKNMKARSHDIENDFQEYFNLKKKYKVKIESPEGIKIYWNNMELYQNEKYENNYYTNINLDFKYEEYPGYKFNCWLVNGKKIYEKDLALDKNYLEEDVTISVIAEYVKDTNHLLISEIYSNGSYDWMKITNSGKDEINLAEYYLSDDEDKLEKYPLPDIILKKGESIIVNGDKNYYAIGDYISNFNLTDYENIYLSTKGIIVESLKVPRASTIETYGRYDNSNTYKFYANYNNSRKSLK